MKTLTRILSSFSLLLLLAFSARSQDVFKVAPIGIGTISPQQALDVAGSIKFSGALMPMPGGVANAGLTGNILLSGGVQPASPTWLANGISGQVLTTNSFGIPVYVAQGYWNLTGNAATNPAFNFIGTTNDYPLVFYTDQSIGISYEDYAGQIDPQYETGSILKGNTYMGGGATTAEANFDLVGGGDNDAGNYNVGFGGGTLGQNTTGIDNVAVGGYFTLILNTTGNYNVALDRGMESNYAGSGSIGIGFDALAGQSGTASYNIGIGDEAGYIYLNGASGSGSTLPNAIGNFNSAIGTEALFIGNTTNDAVSNTAVGNFASLNTTGKQNIAVGDSTLVTNTSGAENAAIGFGANVNGAAYTNATAIGYNSVAKASNSIALGNSSDAYNAGTGAGLYIPGYNTVGSLFYTSAGSGLVATLATGPSTYKLQSNGTAAPTWNNVNPSSGTVTNIIGVAPIVVAGTWTIGIQGTNTNAGGILYSTGSGASAVFTSTGTAGQILISNGTTAPPAWGAFPITAWALTGNSGVTGSNFIGTTTANSFVFHVDGAYAGNIDLPTTSGGNGNVYLGYGVSSKSETAGTGTADAGTYNVAMGYETFTGTSTRNIFIGNEGASTGGGVTPTAADNVGIGYHVLYDLTSGTENTVVAPGAGSAAGSGQGTDGITTGNYNTVFGYSAMALAAPTGSFTNNNDVAIGQQTLNSAYTSVINSATAVGYQSQGGNESSHNTSFGSWAMEGPTADWTNTYGTAVGDSALTFSGSAFAGAYNTALGCLASASKSLTNTTSIGAKSTVTTSNTIILGSSAVTQLGFNGALAPYYGGNYQTGSAGNVFISEGAGVAPQWVADGTSGQLLKSNGAGSAPTWASIGSVFSVATGAGLTGGTITTTGTISLANGTAVGQTYVTGASPYTPALQTMSGDAVISSTGAVTVQGIQTYPVSATAPNAGGILAYNGTQWISTAAGTAGQLLSYNASGVPTWTSSSTAYNVWNLTGNTISATYGNNFVGNTATSGNENLEFKANSAYAGVIDPVNDNVYLGNAGNDAASVVTGAINNVAIGETTPFASAANGSSNNVFIGYTVANPYTATNAGSVAVGNQAMRYSSNSSPNEIFGTKSFYGVSGSSTGTNNTALGFNVAFNYTSASKNVAVGDSDIYAAAAGSKNTAMGTSALKALTSGTNDVGIGRNAGVAVTTSTSTVAVGGDAGRAATGNWGITAVGFYAGATEAGAASPITAVGAFALRNDVLAGSPLVAIGDSVYPSISDEQNMAIGALAGRAYNVGGQDQMTVVGFAALYDMTGTASTQTYSTICGYKSAYNYTTRPSTAADFTTGAYSLYGPSSTEMGSYNLALGFAAMGGSAGSSASTNVAIGSSAFNATNTTLAQVFAAAPLGSITSGAGNVAIGYNAANTSSSLAATPLTSGAYNVAVGINSYVANGSYNTTIGYNATADAGSSAATGSTAIGTGASATAANATAIGGGALAPTANTLILGGTGANAVSVGIGTNAPAQELEIGGTINTIRVDGVGKGGTFGNTAPSLSTDQILFARASGDVYSIPNGSTGQVLTLTGGVPTWSNTASYTATAPLSITSNNLLLSGTSGGVLYGTGSGAAFTAAGNPLNILTEDPITGFPKFDTIIPSSLSSHDNWGTQAAITDSLNSVTTSANDEFTISGNGTDTLPLKLAKQGALVGQVLAWNKFSTYGTWKPGTANASLTTNNIAPVGGSVITVTHGTGQVVGGSNVTLDIRGTSGGVLTGNGAGSSATFTSAGTNGQILTSNGTSAPSWLTPTAPVLWSLTGNSGTTPGINFIGTLDDKQLRFGVGNGSVYAGSLDPQTVGATTYGNVYLGTAATGNGYGGAGNNDAGSYNVGLGLAALSEATASNTGEVALSAGFGLDIQTSGTGSIGIGQYSLRYAGGGNGNIAVGQQTQYGLSSGNYNTGVGADAIGETDAVGASVNSNYNTAMGYRAYENNSLSQGASNTGIGSNSLINTTASRNTAVGDSALYANTTGTNNTALGYQANVTSATATNAIVIGYGATSPASPNNTITLGNSSVVGGTNLSPLTSGIYLPGYTNVGALLFTSAAGGLVSGLAPSATSGYMLQSNGTGLAPTWNNVTPGSGSVTSVTGTAPIIVNGTWNINIQGSSSGTDKGGVLYSTGSATSATFTTTGTSGSYLTSNGAAPPSWGPLFAASPVWYTTGNSGTAPGTDFIGTTDDNQLEIYTDNQYAGSLDPQYENSGATLKGNTYLGMGRSSNGDQGAGNGDVGIYNVAVGNALGQISSASATGNVALGSLALPCVTTGSYNIGIGGYLTLRYAYLGNGNTGVGYQTLYQLSGTSSYNTGIGYSAASASVTSGSNGFATNYTGNYNSILGAFSLNNATNEQASNTAIGTDASYNTSASRNTSVGDSALYSNTSGTNNASLGYAANVSSGTLTNATPVGARAYASTNNSIILGDISGVNGSTQNTNVGIGTNTPATDAALAIQTGHLESQGQLSAGNITASSNAGTGATAAITTGGPGANDISGEITLTTGTGSYSAGEQATVTFANGYTYSPIVNLTPANAAAAAAMTANQVFVTSNTTSFNINFGTAPSSSTPYVFNYYAIETPGTSPVYEYPSYSELCQVPITLTNSQSAATPANFTQMVTVNSSLYSNEMSGLQNIVFTTAAPVSGVTQGTVLNAWIESGNSSSATSTVYWVNLGSTSILAHSSITIYMNIVSPNILSATGPTGEAPQLSIPYAQYDNGSLVFNNFYDNFKGTSLASKWSVASGVTYSINGGITNLSCPGHWYGIYTNTFVNCLNTIAETYCAATNTSGNGVDIATPGGYPDGVEYEMAGGSSSPGQCLFGVGGTLTTSSEANENQGGIQVQPNTYYLLSAYITNSPAPIMQLNYTTQVTGTGSPAPTTVNGGVGLGASNATGSFQWFRDRIYPPSGVMPAVGFSSETCP